MHQDELRKLTDDVLLALARNPCAKDSRAMIRLLIERGSNHVLHPDLLPVASEMIISNPPILKVIDPVWEARNAKSLEGVADTLEAQRLKAENLAHPMSEVDAKHDFQLAEAREKLTQSLAKKNP